VRGTSKTSVECSGKRVFTLPSNRAADVVQGEPPQPPFIRGLRPRTPYTVVTTRRPRTPYTVTRSPLRWLTSAFTLVRGDVAHLFRCAHRKSDSNRLLAEELLRLAFAHTGTGGGLLL
jgi:hypothetical protein